MHPSNGKIGALIISFLPLAFNLFSALIDEHPEILNTFSIIALLGLQMLQCGLVALQLDALSGEDRDESRPRVFDNPALRQAGVGPVAFQVKLLQEQYCLLPPLPGKVQVDGFEV